MRHLFNSLFFADSYEIMWPLITTLNVSHSHESETSPLSFEVRNSSMIVFMRALKEWSSSKRGLKHQLYVCITYLLIYMARNHYVTSVWVSCHTVKAKWNIFAKKDCDASGLASKRSLEDLGNPISS